MIPKLRFPEFSGEWEEKKLGELASKVGSGSTPRGGSKVYKKTGVPFVRSQNVTGGKLDMSDVVFIDEATHESMTNSAIQPNDVLLNITGASLGRTCVVPDNFNEGNLSQHVCIIRLNGTNPYLVHTVLSKPRSLQELLKTQTGGGKEGLNFQAVRAFKLVLPGKDEQQKIAGFLGTVDERIFALQKRVELMKKYKKDIMQKIFPPSHKASEGQVPEIRFKDDDGKDYPAWQEKKFSECLESLATNSHQIKSSSFKTNGKYPVVDQGKDKIAGYTDEAAKVFKKIPVIIFGDHTTFLKYIDFEFVVGADGTKVLRSKSNNPKYLFYALQNNRVEPEGYKRHFSILKTHLLPLPSAEEQQKIADFLSSIDEKIDLTERKLEQAKKFKKALLQQMFV